MALEYVIPEGSDFRLHHPFCCIIAGPSGSGKTSLLVNLLRAGELAIDCKYDRVVYCYGEELPETFKQLSELGLNVELHHGLPDPLKIDFKAALNNCLILDDLMQECSDSKVVCDYFTKTAHHKNISVFMLTQNFYQQGKYQVTITRNANYIIVFKSPRERTQVAQLGRQLGNEAEILSAYDHVSKKPNGYLLIDCTQNTPDQYRLRTDILNANRGIIYIEP
jgi:hypothetical protein